MLNGNSHAQLHHYRSSYIKMHPDIICQWIIPTLHFLNLKFVFAFHFPLNCYKIGSLIVFSLTKKQQPDTFTTNRSFGKERKRHKKMQNYLKRKQKYVARLIKRCVRQYVLLSKCQNIQINSKIFHCLFSSLLSGS